MKIGKAILSVLAILCRILICLFLILMIYRLAFKAYDFGYRVFAEPAVAEGAGIDVVVQVPLGSDASEIGKILKNAGLIKDDKLFVAQELLSEYHGKLEPGTYSLNTSMTSEEMMAAMSPATEESTEEAP